MRFDAVLERLQVALAQPLPGRDAQALMSPRPPREWPDGFNQAGVRQAAALLLLFPVAGEAHMILTVRSDRLGRHGGQVSLPGGVTEPGESYEHAALREAEEEVALAPEVVEVLGALTPIDIPISGFRLHPIVGATPARPTLAPADGEVARILEVALAELCDPAHQTSLTIGRDGRTIVAPAFHVSGATIWGATAMVIAEFLTLLGWRFESLPE